MNRMLPSLSIVSFKSDFNKLTFRRILNVYTLIMALMSPAANGSQLDSYDIFDDEDDSPIPALPQKQVGLSEVWVGDNLVIPIDDAQHGRLYQIDGKNFKINFHPINLAAHPIQLDITFEDFSHQAPHPQYQHHTILEAQKKATVFNGPIYTPENGKSLNDFVNALGSTYPGSQVFWTTEEDIQDVGESIKFVFRQDKLIRFYDNSRDQGWYDEVDEKLHETRILLPYGFVREGASNNHLLCRIQHQKKSSQLKNDIWYLDSARKLVKVQEIKYETVPQNLKQWSIDNSLSSNSYKELMPETENAESDQIFVLSPPGKYPIIELDPADANVLEKYYRRESLLNPDLRQIVYFDGSQVCQTQQKEWKCFEQIKSKNGIDFMFADAKASPCYISTVRSTKCILTLPSLGQARHVQFVHEGTDFQEGFYECVFQDSTSEGVIQEWEHLEMSADPVQINISGINKNCQLVPLSDEGKEDLFESLFLVEPILKGNQYVFDLSAQDILDVQEYDWWDDLQNYLLAAYWLKGEEALLKCEFPKTPENPGKLSENVSNLLKNTNGLQIDFDCGYFLTKDRGGSLALRKRDDYEKRDRNDGSDWNIVLYVSLIKALLKEVPDKSTLDLTQYGLPSSAALLNCLIQEQPFKKILLKELDKTEWDKLKYSPADLMKFLLKVEGLKTLKLAQMNGLQKCNLPKILAKNCHSLVHLDLTSSEINSWQRQDFVNGVGQMANLQSLKVIGTGLSNGQTVDLARNLKNLGNLSLVHLEMPYWINTGVEGWWRVMGEVSQEWWDANPVAKVYEGIKITAAVLPAGAFSLIIGAGADAVGYTPGIDVKRALMALSNIKSLTSLKMKTAGGFKHQNLIREFFNSYRETSKLPDVDDIVFVE